MMCVCAPPPASLRSRATHRPLTLLSPFKQNPQNNQVLFTFAPTFLELGFVLALLATRFSPAVAALVGVTFEAYCCWTLALTQAAVDVRKQVNALDNMTTSKAVDALLNAETVALFDNSKLEVCVRGGGLCLEGVGGC